MGAKESDLAPPNKRCGWKIMQKQQDWQSKVFSGRVVITVAEPSGGRYGFEGGRIHSVISLQRQEDLYIGRPDRSQRG
jgi:hypothetical protein